MVQKRQVSDVASDCKSKEDLWKDALEKELAPASEQDGSSSSATPATVTVQLVGMDSPDHTVFLRVIGENHNISKVTIGQVLQCMMDESYDRLVHDILEHKKHVDKDLYPPPPKLLELGAVWLLNETSYTQGHGAHAHRLAPKDMHRVVDWNDLTLRVHMVPDRFHVAHEYDWSKYCRGRLVGDKIEVTVGGETPHIPVNGLPDHKDGVIVYEDLDHGFTLLNKPGPMPGHATLHNHAEDVCSMFQAALQKRSKEAHERMMHVSLPQRLDAETATHGLMVVATRREFLPYLQQMKLDHVATNSKLGVVKKYRCLVCVKNENVMDLVEDFQLKKTIITHYVDPKLTLPQRLERHKPNGKDWVKCQMRITQVGDDGMLRASCVSSKYKDSVDWTLAHRLWENKDNNEEALETSTPAEDLHVSYVMQVEVEALTNRLHQIRSQLAALGLPIVGDTVYGGGECKQHAHQHAWTRMALQCCEISFFEPQWQDEAKKSLTASERLCRFRLKDAWWTEFLEHYKQGV